MSEEIVCKFPCCFRHPLKNGYCVNHQIYSDVKIEKEKYVIPKVSEKKNVEIKEHKPVKNLLNKWFAEIEKIEFKKGVCNCWNCGEPIYQAFARTAIAHILPKRKNMFPSVATHPFNYLILGAGCGCHNEFDRTYQDASKMQIWQLAIDRVQEVIPSISNDELKHLPEIIINAVKANKK